MIPEEFRDSNDIKILTSEKWVISSKFTDIVYVFDSVATQNTIMNHTKEYKNVDCK